MTLSVETQTEVSQLYFYVATNGNDNWSGKLPAANAAGADGPFTTLTRARDAIRAIKKKGQFNAPVSVMVLGGTYYFDEPLVLEAEDSGTAEQPVTYTAYPGEKPILSGGKKITEWKPYKGKILQAALPDIAEGKWKFRQLFFNGERQIRARWPKYDVNDPMYGGWAFVEEIPSEDEHSPDTFQYESTTQPHEWSKPHLGEINIFPWYCWLNDIVPLKALDTSTHTITLGGKLLMADLMKPFPGNRFIVENVLEELDGPGQWCLDTETGTVYFWPPEDSVESGEVIAPVVYDLIELRGTADKPIRYVNVSGFTMTQTLSPFPELKHPNFHSPTLRGEAIRLENAEDCGVENNTLYAIGGDGVRLQDYTARNRILDNEIAHSGAAGISIAGAGPGNPHVWTDKKELKKAAKLCPQSVRNVISNNHIHHCGIIKKTCGAIQVYAVKSIDNLISHNWIHHTSDKGISMQDGFGRFFVEYNELHDIGREICDTGGIQTNRWLVMEGDKDLCHGSVFRYNLIRNVIGCRAYRQVSADAGGFGSKGRLGNKAGGKIWTSYLTWGIMFDNSPMNFTVFGNIVISAARGGISMPVADPKDNLIENNIFIDCTLCQADLFSGRDVGRGNRFLRNILYCTAPEGAILAIGPTTRQVYSQCDHNLYFPGNGSDPIIKEIADDGSHKIMTLDQWHKDGFDTHSVVADPLFVDFANGDYRLRPESPAFALGFTPIDIGRIGLMAKLPVGPLSGK